MATTEILPFATAGGANVQSQADYAAAASTAAGFAAGIAQSAFLNKVWRQSAFMAAVLANFEVAQGVSVPDDGNLSAAVTGLETALTAFVGTLISAGLFYYGGTTGGTANAQTATATGFTLTAGNVVAAVIGTTNTGALTLKVGTTAATNVYIATSSGAAPCKGGEAVAGNIGLFEYDGTEYQLLNPVAPATYVQFSSTGGTVVINKSSNITSVSRSSAGIYVVTFTNNMSNAFYGITGFVADGTHPDLMISGASAPTISGLTVQVESTASAYFDAAYIYLEFVQHP